MYICPLSSNFCFPFTLETNSRGISREWQFQHLPARFENTTSYQEKRQMTWPVARNCRGEQPYKGASVWRASARAQMYAGANATASKCAASKRPRANVREQVLASNCPRSKCKLRRKPNVQFKN